MLAVLGARLASLLAALLSIVLVARALGPEGQGRYALCVLAAGLIVILSGAGAFSAIVFSVARDAHSRRELLGLFLLSGLAMGALSAALAVAVSRFGHPLLLRSVPADHVTMGLLLVLPIMLSQGAQAFLQGLRRFRTAALLSATQASLSLLLLWVSLHVLGGDVKSALAANGIGTMLVSTLSLVWIVALTGPPRLPTVASLREPLSFGARAHVGIVIQILHYRVDAFLLEALRGASAVGIYAIAVQIAEQLWIAPEAAGAALFPRVAGGGAPRGMLTSSISRAVAALSVSGALLAALVAPPLIPLVFGSDYGPAAAPLLALLPGAVFLAVAKVLSPDIAGRGKPLWNASVSGVCLLVNVALNLALVPTLGPTGAAISSTVSYGLMLLLMVRLHGLLAGTRPRDILMPRREDLAQAIERVRSLHPDIL